MRDGDLVSYSIRRPRALVRDLLNFKSPVRAAHGFDNASPEDWIMAFKKLIKGRRASMSLTGGEPMIDVKNMSIFLKGILREDSLDNLRIDTNGSWPLSAYSDLERELKSKIYFNISYHPSQAQFEPFFERVLKIRDSGFNVSMINFVLEYNQVKLFKEISDRFSSQGIKVDPAVYYQKRRELNQETKALLYNHLAESDLEMKLGGNPKGLKCRFPQIGLQLMPDGTMFVPCFPKNKVDILTSRREEIDSLLMKDISFCPKKECFCLHMYSFLDGWKRNLFTLNPLEAFVGEAIKGS
jgi:organic radical activating enzyme